MLPHDQRLITKLQFSGSLSVHVSAFLDIHGILPIAFRAVDYGWVKRGNHTMTQMLALQMSNKIVRMCMFR